jgi:hypothetical protein
VSPASYELAEILDVFFIYQPRQQEQPTLCNPNRRTGCAHRQVTDSIGQFYNQPCDIVRVGIIAKIRLRDRSTDEVSDRRRQRGQDRSHVGKTVSDFGGQSECTLDQSIPLTRHSYHEGNVDQRFEGRRPRL